VVEEEAVVVVEAVEGVLGDFLASGEVWHQGS
jgi:hypothetical protein